MALVSATMDKNPSKDAKEDPKKTDKRGIFQFSYGYGEHHDQYPHQDHPHQHSNPHDHHYGKSQINTVTTITKEVPVYYEKQVPYPVHVPVPVQHPYPVHVPKPYPVHIEKHVPYPVPIKVPVVIEKAYPVHIEKPYPVHIEKPYHTHQQKSYAYDNPYPAHALEREDQGANQYHIERDFYYGGAALGLGHYGTDQHQEYQ